MICDNVRLCRNGCIDAEVSLCTSPVFVMPYQHLLLKPFTLSNSMCPCAWALMGISKVVWDYEQPKLHWQLQFHQLFPWLSCSLPYNADWIVWPLRVELLQAVRAFILQFQCLFLASVIYFSLSGYLILIWHSNLQLSLSHLTEAASVSSSNIIV